ncbi:MAG: helicase C-terminal domain-containing protein, partial [Bacteroidales bacterium]|nr:helicase C-terminal domain-containing protein [Bacteroidales bacterium]
DYSDIKSRRKQVEEVRANEWFNALQVKYAYALTCHKTQGGQWERVFVDAPWNPDNVFTTNDLRWFYTAITRASRQVWMAGFDLSYFET